MFDFIRKYSTKLRKSEKGMFTLEASLIFPIIFIVTISLILFSLVVYQKVVIYQKAHLIAERAAFTWDNSKKDFETGSFGMGEYTTDDDGDGLYWRTNFIGQQFLEKILGEGSMGSATGAKRERAQTNGAAMFTSGTVEFTEPGAIGIDRRLQITTSSELKIPDFVDLISDDHFETTVTASVKDPMELIRSTDFIVHYAKEVMNYIKNK